MTSSSTSSSERAPDAGWRRFTLTLLGVAAGLPALLYLAILVIDPFDNVPLSPDLPRIQVGGADRRYKPSVARRPEYDSVLVGTSSSMLLHPGRLDRPLGASFASLSMPAASPFEQLRLLRLFHDHHPAPRAVVVGLDRVWCMPEGAARQIGANVGQPMRDRLYDGNRWNDWPELNSQVLKYARRQLMGMLDPAGDPAGHDGYYDFTAKDYGAYDLARARRNIYGKRRPPPRPQEAPALAVAPGVRQGWAFPDLAALERALQRLPTATAKVLMFMPDHWFDQPEPGSLKEAELAECKRRAAAIGGRLANGSVIDFMRRTPITLEDRNYWDGVHFTDAVARQLERVLAATLKGERVPGESYLYLAP